MAKIAYLTDTNIDLIKLAESNNIGSVLDIDVPEDVKEHSFQILLGNVLCREYMENKIKHLKLIPFESPLVILISKTKEEIERKDFYEYIVCVYIEGKWVKFNTHLNLRSLDSLLI